MVLQAVKAVNKSKRRQMAPHSPSFQINIVPSRGDDPFVTENIDSVNEVIKS